MAKSRSAFFCQECGYEAPRWMGRCPGCGTWNSMVEEPAARSGGRGLLSPEAGAGGPPVAIGDVETADAPRLATGIDELDRVLGGGIVPGSFVLVGGDPGIGKSTILLQLAARVAGQHGPVLYVSGEESARQIRLRADRLGTLHPRLLVLAETNLEAIAHHAAQLAPRLLIVDSIQTVFRPDLPSAPGSVSQVRECAAQLLRVAKGQNIAVFTVGHVTKEGALAGPRVLEHIVDTVLYFEGDRHDLNRLHLIIAVLEKRVGLLLGSHDAYVKVAGGVRLAEPAIDLALAVALASSFRDQPPDPRTVVVGEVGLAGEVRAVSRIDQRIREAEKMGFDRMVLPQANLRSLSMKTDLELVGVETVMEGLEAALSR